MNVCSVDKRIILFTV